MSISKLDLWKRYQERLLVTDELGLALDTSRVDFPPGWLVEMEPRMQRAFIAMAELEKGGIANPDEHRMVGHYWLRNSKLAPTQTISDEIDQTLVDVQQFAATVHGGKIRGERGPFKNVLIVGIGGSALGPQFVAHALGSGASDKLVPYFLDNSDPDGMDRVLGGLKSRLGETLCVVISKSGGTPETRNGMLESKAAWERAGLNFSRHAVAVTGFGSTMDKYAVANGWLRRFPMWDWVGGRTSETSVVGLLPAALQGLDILGLLAGAKACDAITRQPETRRNPAAQLALAWYFLGEGRGSKDMVVLPYKDRLELFSRYLQQLVMESLGKEFDLSGKNVQQGIAVYGNKGSTDQHAYVQQLRDGVLNFFAVFIQVLKDRPGVELEVDPGITSGDYLTGFWLGTREALYEKGRQSITLRIPEVSGFSVGVLIALFERAVGLYAVLVNVNAYHQPGVEAGKKAAATVLALQTHVVQRLQAEPGKDFSADELALSLGVSEQAETILHICVHLAANSRQIVQASGKGIAARFSSKT